ncbi:MAG TPA: 50S ribosomal protein L3 N(5)-glutamine methyltransferase [Burkholderiales bacterium]|nr:50S ribosomal protein L3 N(5)-glutamine methyltransferase [Burkholderiales bacterium]
MALRRPQTLADFFHHAVRRLTAARLHYGHGTHNARDEAAYLVLHTLGLPLDALRVNLQRPLSASELRRLDAIVERRARERIPAAYLTHEAWLGEFSFYVDRRTIVPRSFIAELLRSGLSPLLRRPVRRALDLCTGSGCLAVLLAHYFPRAEIDAADLSAGALAVARRNVARYRLQSRIRLIRSDLFASLANERYDLIVTNPPYVSAAAMRALPAEYRHEPRLALAGGNSGFDLVSKILAAAPAHLSARGLLLCEIGHHRKALERAYPRIPFVWPETSAGPGYVFLLEREALPALEGCGRCAPGKRAA